MLNILIVDDEAAIRQSLKGVLEDEGYKVSLAESGEACLEALKKRTTDVVLLDIWLPGIDGLETLEKIKELKDSDNGPEVIMISGHGTIETAVRATKLGAFDFIEKPLSLEKTLILVKHAAETKKLRGENRDLKKQLQPKSAIVGESIPMKALRQQIALMAPTNGRVLIYGESGSGKELAALAIHAESLRKDSMFVEVNCAAIPEDLIESELFGHRKGSFPGASNDKEGKFHKADGGTLFLDEVGDMSLKTQSKVLRTLDEQRFTPVGSDEHLTVDVRVIAATNKDLEDEISKGNFREDLFYRLNVIPFLRSAAARAQRRYPAAGAIFSEGDLRHLQPPPARDHRRRHRDPDALPVAGQRARAAQRDRAHRDHESHRHPLRPQAPSAAGLSRGPRPQRRTRLHHAPPGPRRLRARLHSEEARREPRQHLPHGRSAGP